MDFSQSWGHSGGKTLAQRVSGVAQHLILRFVAEKTISQLLHRASIAIFLLDHQHLQVDHARSPECVKYHRSQYKKRRQP